MSHPARLLSYDVLLDGLRAAQAAKLVVERRQGRYGRDGVMPRVFDLKRQYYLDGVAAERARIVKMLREWLARYGRPDIAEQFIRENGLDETAECG